MTPDGAGDGDGFPIAFATEKNVTWNSDLTVKNLTTELTHGSNSDVIHVDLPDKLQRSILLRPIMKIMICKKAYDNGLKYGNSKDHPHYKAKGTTEYFRQQNCCDPMHPPPHWESCGFPFWETIQKMRQAKKDKEIADQRKAYEENMREIRHKSCQTEKLQGRGHPECVKEFGLEFYVPLTCDESSCSCFEDIDPSKVSKKSFNTKTGYLVDWTAGL